jgi:hypothetical protein
MLNATIHAVDIYVSPTGSDLNPGTKDKPLATVASALRKARELRRLKDSSITDGIHIILRGGNYQLYEPLFIRPEDAGTQDSPTFIEAAANESPVLSGGISVTGWTVLKQAVEGLSPNAKGKIWMVDVSLNGPSTFRQLWINNKKAVRARDKNADSMYRILSWNKSEQTCWIPTPKTLSLKNSIGVEMFIHQWWAIATLRIKDFEVHGDSTRLSFYQPESKIQSEHPWPAPWISKETGNSAFYLVNAIQFLDEPGEWYFDNATRKLYYWPRENEDMKKALVTVPSLETLVKMEGTADHPVQYVNFKNISFQHTGWLRPSDKGHVPLQAGMYLLDAYKLKTPGTQDKATLENQAWVGRPAAAVELSFADHTGFIGCSFQHLASTALDHKKGTHNNVVVGNLFKDIGGSAILAGVFSDETTEAHLPYRPADSREVCSDIQITNNLITDATNEDWGCVGIGAGYVKNTLISHNDISDISYTGISVGWGWTPTNNVMQNNRIIRNRIHHYGKHMYDVAGIYTLSSQPGSFISENSIDSIYKAPYAHIPSHWFYIYTDEGSSYLTIKNNWCPSEKFLQNANGPANTWMNNGPQVNDSVRRLAGLQQDFQYLAKEKAISNGWPINHEMPVMLELIVKNSKEADVQQLRDILARAKMDTSSLYQWENHYVIFGKVQDVFLLKERIRKAFPDGQLKSYDDLFYEFNRSRCGEKSISRDWDHTLLTANLVEDKKLQKEYLDYHATQFEKWPEIARGFCNAQFQQLLIFRNGRQLILVISIPKGESLDKLNPKTVENNPRVDDWNNLMKKYQVGIEGTKKGEVWVFLKQVLKSK